MAYFDDRPGSFVFCRDFVSCEQDWEICIIRKITKGKKGFSTLTGLLIAVVYTAVIWMAWGSMNAIVCILHLIVFWMVSEAIFALITKIRKKTFAKYYAGIVAIVFTVCYLAAG